MGSEPGPDAATIAALTGHVPADPALFVAAFTHGSHAPARADRAGRGDYQRLEFLGDRVLGLVIAAMLYARFPFESEGALSARLNGLVTREACADIARTTGLGPMIRLGKQARDDGGRDSDNILGDVTEALIGALYLDGGLAVATAFIERHWAARIDTRAAAPKHPKSALMEWAAAHRRKAPDYVLVAREGPDHAPRFTVAVSVGNAGAAQATGSTKQDAERAAAAMLLGQLEHGS